MGVGHQVHAFANALARRGHAVHVFSRYPAPEDALYGATVVPVGRRLRTFQFAWHLRDVDFSGFDVLHAHGDDYWLWSNKRPPRVRTMHGSCLVEAVHVPGAANRLRMLALYAAELLSACVADRTVCVSHDTLKYYPRLRQVIPNGVNLDAFHPGEKEPVPTMLFVGTYGNRKRGKLLMELFANQIRPQVPNARLWMVCSDAPAAQGVRVFGRVDENVLTELYRRAWVFCLPSSYEGFGLPYIEAMASGTAVVATPNAGAREVTREGRDGLLAADDKLGETLVRVLQDAALRTRLREAGLARAQDFSFERVCAAYEAVYAELIAKRAGRPAAR